MCLFKVTSDFDLSCIIRTSKRYENFKIIRVIDEKSNPFHSENLKQSYNSVQIISLEQNIC